MRKRIGALTLAVALAGTTTAAQEVPVEEVMLDNGMKREDSVKDIGALLDWIATQPDLDASRVDEEARDRGREAGYGSVRGSATVPSTTLPTGPLAR